MKRFIIILVALLCFGRIASAQQVTLGTNFIQVVDFGTINLETHIALTQHTSLGVGGRYNRWDYHRLQEDHLLNRKRSLWVGVRYWPWNVYSGWYFGAKAQYQEYNRNIFMKYKSQGDEYGLGLQFGYAFMLNEHWNLEFGAGAWGGIDYYSDFTKAELGRFMRSGKKGFVLPDDLHVGIYYIF